MSSTSSSSSKAKKPRAEVRVRPYRDETDREAVRTVFGQGMADMKPPSAWLLMRRTWLSPLCRRRAAGWAAAGVAACALLTGGSPLGTAGLFVAGVYGFARAALWQMPRFADEYVRGALGDDMADVEEYYQRAPGGRGGFWVAESPSRPGEILGHVALDTRTKSPESGSVEVRRVSVARSARGMGVATALMSHAEGVARREGFDRIELSTSTFQDAALSMYARRGYRTQTVLLYPAGPLPLPVHFLELPLRDGVPPGVPPTTLTPVKPKGE